VKTITLNNAKIESGITVLKKDIAFTLIDEEHTEQRYYIRLSFEEVEKIANAYDFRKVKPS
jgi:hypothetical protein